MAEGPSSSNANFNEEGDPLFAHNQDDPEVPESSGALDERPPITKRTDPEDWVADEPRLTRSKFSGQPDGVEIPGLFKVIEDPPNDNWEIIVPAKRRRIFHNFGFAHFAMYQIAFQHFGYRLPFSDFEVAIFHHLMVAPSQLHPNSLAFMRAFEVVCSHLDIVPTIPLFFFVFGIQRSKPKGDPNRLGWVSFKQTRRLFYMFEESLRPFKDEWYIVAPKNAQGWADVIVPGPDQDENGDVILGEDGQPVLVDYGKFHFRWEVEHYLVPANKFTTPRKELKPDEWEDFLKLQNFVRSFKGKAVVDEDGNPCLDDDGNPLTVPRYINVKKILACSTRAEAEETLSMLVYFIVFMICLPSLLLLLSVLMVVCFLSFPIFCS